VGKGQELISVWVVVGKGFPESDVSVGTVWVVVGKGFQELKSVLEQFGLLWARVTN
jgi:hypothetical protein